MQIRPVIEADISQLHSLMIQYIVDFYLADHPGDHRLTNHINYLLANPIIGKQFVAEENDELLGFATLYFTYSTTRVQKIAILNDLFVDPHARGKSIGEQLFLTCQQYCKAEGFATMNWETAQDNLSAQALYRKMGGKRADHDWQFYTIDLKD